MTGPPSAASGALAGWRSAVPRWREVGLALAGLVLDVVGFSMVLSSASADNGMVLGYAVLGYAVLVWRSAAPVTVFAALWLHSTAAVLLVPTYGPVVGMMIALFTVASRVGHRVGIVALAATFVPTGLRVAAEVAGVPAGMAVAALVASAVLLSLISGGAWSLGRWSRSQQERLTLLDRQRELAARDAVARERTRIARDLHDVISHSVSVMSLQAAGAQRVLHSRPERAEQALSDIQAAGAQAMTELRRLLVVLRTDDDPDPAGQFAHEGLADLDALLDTIRSAGIPARLSVPCAPRDLDTGADLTAYRVVQEALTNIARHAGPGTPTLVEINWCADDLVVNVRNDAPPYPRPVNHAPGGGHGLVGLHERVAALGGRLDAGPEPDGGFHVTVTLPAPLRHPPGPAEITTGSGAGPNR